MRIAMVMPGELSPNYTHDGTLCASFQSQGVDARFADWPSFGRLDWVNHIYECNSFLPKELRRLISFQRRGRDSNPR